MFHALLHPNDTFTHATSQGGPLCFVLDDPPFYTGPRIGYKSGAFVSNWPYQGRRLTVLGVTSLREMECVDTGPFVDVI